MQPRTGRSCSRAGCRAFAVKTLTYIYSDSTAVLGPLATFAEPHAYDLCDEHSERMTLPKGWTVIRPEPNGEAQGPSDDDLMAIADAVREAGISQNLPTAGQPKTQEIGRRGHLRALPSN
ncbi:MAG: DUF3499 domain-containing protein [Actinomycetes bacterium]